MEQPDFWRTVKNICKEKNISMKDLSLKVGYANEKYISTKKTRGAVPSIEEARKIAGVLGVSLDTLVNGVVPEIVGEEEVKKNTDKFFVPVLNQKLSAGYGQILPADDEIVGYMEVPKSLRQYGKNLAVLHVDGDSMEPTLHRGDMVVCDSLGYDGEGIYALQRDGDGYIKRVTKEGNKYLIISDNKLYPMREESVTSEAFRIIGRVHCVLNFI